MTLSRAVRERIGKIARGRADEPLRILEGAKAVLEALEAGAVSDVWIRRDLDVLLADRLRDAASRSRARLGEASAEDFERLGTTVTPQGVLALVRDTATDLDDLVGRPGPLLWLDGVQDPGNVGAVVRVAAAFGIAGIVATEGTADPLGLKALRASAGLALRVPLARTLAEKAVPACAAARRSVWLLDRAGDDVFAIRSVPAGLVLVVGSEARGAGEAARRAATRSVGVPIRPSVDSLNAAVATGIAVAVLSRRSG